jgi:hypothetical protein
MRFSVPPPPAPLPPLPSSATTILHLPPPDPPPCPPTRYTELQVGPAASQMHTFPIGPSTADTLSEYQWTEWFKAWQVCSS